MANTPAVAGGATGAGVLVVWLLGHFGVDVSAEAGVAIGGGTIAVLLFVGHNGLRGVWRRVLYGDPPPPVA